MKDFLSYMGLVRDAVVTTCKGMWITLKVLFKVNTRGAVTIQYPEVKDKIPLGSRGLLFNDVEDCISCLQCVIACPVDCITIEAEKRPRELEPNLTKGGIKKTLDLSKFDIDMSLCCYCGLCSAACPTDCLYHTKEYEYSVMDRDKHNMDFMNYQR